MSEERKHLFDDPRNTRLVVRALVAACVILALLDLVLHRHGAHPWEGVIGFYSLYGFGACVLLVLLAKEMPRFCRCSWPRCWPVSPAAGCAPP
jgi:hypothetical protein